MNLEKTVKMGDALSNITRIKIIHLLNKNPMNIYEMAKTLNLSRPVIYTHLKKLEEADLVESDLILEEARAKRIYKSKEFKFYIDNDKIDEFFK
ncbi:regulatory protein ArsR [Methanococcus aeolicus Nankai-3]|uniref:Regulatory protein ArsR n=1 Tax=Methanococcus aeolicus (strain ATCC BAA-1280 / DSM 17508 / OCM 812 / Nankai-3) TaxID=419665 RepID=A6UVE7_META3|nr:winged helix-turn-helix domain-containing protein [Methanococcus aeolicus]ABR56469.1 regulatory protein ArsR [Methanococcus aeolicus Nankai-3]